VAANRKPKEKSMNKSAVHGRLRKKLGFAQKPPRSTLFS